MKDLGSGICWDEKLCKRCDICVNLCSAKGLKLENNELELTGKCIKCRMCERYCPERAIEVKNENPNNRK
ncbi:MAG: 4Fe-4S binding protein [Candidatus Woesearchaeota archaeon]